MASSSSEDSLFMFKGEFVLVQLKMGGSNPIPVNPNPLDFIKFLRSIGAFFIGINFLQFVMSNRSIQLCNSVIILLKIKIGIL